MGLFLRQDENRSELQSRIAAELQQKLKDQAKIDTDPPSVEDSTMLENQHETHVSSNGITIGILVLVLIIIVVFVTVRSQN